MYPNPSAADRLTDRHERLSRIHEQTTLLQLAAHFDIEAKAGETLFRRDLAGRAASAVRAVDLGESDWLALLRVAVMSLALAVEHGEFMVDLVGRDLDRLSDTLRRIENGEA